MHQKTLSLFDKEEVNLKLGFFTKLYYAITDFRLYPYVVQKEKLKDAFWYFFSFIFLICIILSATTMIKVTNWLNEFVTEYHEQVMILK